MVETRRGLEIIIDAASTLFDFRSMQRLAEGVLTQIASLLNVECAGILVLREDGDQDEKFSVLAGSGCYSEFVGRRAPATARAGAARARRARPSSAGAHEFRSERSVLYIGTGSGREMVVLLEAGKSLSDTDRALVEVFCSRLSVAFDNVHPLRAAAARRMPRLEERVAEPHRAS